MERQGATSGRPTWGENQSTVTDDGPHHQAFLHDTDACVVTSTDEMHPSTPDVAYDSAHRTPASRRQLQLAAHQNGAHLRDSHHGSRYGTLTFR